MKKLLLFSCLVWAASGMAVASIAVTQTAEQLGKKYSWTAGEFYTSFDLDTVVTISAHQPDSGRLNGYYSPDTPRDWRLYQARNNGEFSVSVKAGYIIRSICFVYGNKNNGVLSLVKGSNIASSNQVASGKMFLVGSNSLTLYAGSSSASTAAQVKLTQFTVTYESADSNAVAEYFSQVSQPSAIKTEVSWQGDYADWQVCNVRRGAKDTLNGGLQGTWSTSGGYLRSTNAEGGIKRLQFNWRQFVRDTVVPLTLAIQAGDWRDTTSMQSVPDQSVSVDHSYSADISCKENVQLSFMNISPAVAAEKDRFLLGDLYITPYIYIAPSNRSFYFLQKQGQFDLSQILQDNTEGEGEIVYTILSDETDSATISGSIVDFSQSTNSGTILVQVSWNNGKVALSPVALFIAVPERGEYFVETFSSCTKTQVSGTTYVVGDGGVYGWNLTHFARRDVDTVAGQQAILIGYSGGMVMNGVQEGGIMRLKFNWRANNSSQPVRFLVSVDGEQYKYTCTAAQSKGETQLYSRVFNVAYNTAMSITLEAKQSTAQSEIEVGPLSIMPYILFRTKRDTVVLDDTTSYCLDSMLINNTEQEVTYSILSDETGAASLQGGVLDLSQVTRQGVIKVQASWQEVTTTMMVFARSSSTGLSSFPSGEDRGEATKILKDGHLLILKDGLIFNAQGQPLK